MNNIFKLHSIPQVMIFDRDPIFASRFWKELFALMGNDLRMSSACHSQIDDQSERVNQCMEVYLRCFAHACPTQWAQYLSLAEYWYNTSYHSAIKMSPFVALYEHEPRHWGIDAASTLLYSLSAGLADSIETLSTDPSTQPEPCSAIYEKHCRQETHKTHL
jgi:hypothetical protein